MTLSYKYFPFATQLILGQFSAGGETVKGLRLSSEKTLYFRTFYISVFQISWMNDVEKAIIPNTTMIKAIAIHQLHCSSPASLSYIQSDLKTELKSNLSQQCP